MRVWQRSWIRRPLVLVLWVPLLSGLGGCKLSGDKSEDSSGSSVVAPATRPAVERRQMQVNVSGAGSETTGDVVTLDYPVLLDKNDRIPDWVINPGLGGVLGAVGVASKKDLGTKEQLEEARVSARLELATMLEVRLQTVGRTELEEQYRTASGGRFDNSRKEILGIDRDILDVVLAGTRQRALWFDPESQECFVWIVLDGSVLQDVDHYVTDDDVSVFLAKKLVTTEYLPERKKPVVPQVLVEPAEVPEAPKEPIEKLEESLKPIRTIPIEDDDLDDGGER